MSTDIKPEDIEAAIAAAEQRRRLRMGEAAEAKAAAGGASARHQPVLERSRPAAPAQPTLTGARDLPRAGASGSAADDELDDSWLDQPAKPKAAGNRYADLPETEVVWEPEPARRGLIVPFAIAAIALLAFGGILWWAYGSSEEIGGPLPVITAEEDPVKVKPVEEGGLEVPDQDKLVYDQIAEGEGQTQSGVEQLLPDPEEPVAPPQPPTAAVPAPLSDPDADTAAALAVAPAAGGAGEDANTNTDPAADTQPVDQSVAAASVPSAEQPAQSAATTPATPSASPVPAEPSVPAPAASTQEPAAEPAEVAKAPEAAQPAAPAPSAPAAGAGKWRIQLASVKSESAAKQEWSRMQRAHPDLLGDMRLTVQRADLGDKGVFFRLQAGPLPNRTTAEDVCAELKSSKQPCIIVRP